MTQTLTIPAATRRPARAGKFAATITDISRTTRIPATLRVTFAVEYIDGPRIVTRDFPFSMHPRSGLRQFLVDLGLEAEVMSGPFDLVALIGKKTTVRVKRKILASKWTVVEARAV